MQKLDLSGYNKGDILNYCSHIGIRTHRTYIRVYEASPQQLVAKDVNDAEYRLTPNNNHVRLKKASWLEMLFLVPKELKF